MSARRTATRGPGARVPITDQTPSRIMVVSCPDLGSLELGSLELGGPELGSPELGGANMSGLELGSTGTSGPDLVAARLLEQVIAVVTGFCPKVEVVEPGVCAFGARGPARYFGGETALAARIIAAVADLGVESRVGVADGLFAALLAARIATPPRPTRAVPRPTPPGPIPPRPTPPGPIAATRSWSYRRVSPRSSWPRSR